MKEKINKPRAFISYSSRDSNFIDRVEQGLRECQIEPWRDRSEIRDGQPWFDSIFEEGLPTCDVIIAYFTINSLKSDMMTREVDAAQVRLLSDKGVSFLPYVDDSETRNSLRLDLQARHSRVWNDENFLEVLPSVVAEIWRSYTERIVSVAVAQERTRRLEAELELQTLRSSLNDSAFSPQEVREFQYIYGKLQGLKDATALVYSENKADKVRQMVGTCRVRVSFIQALKRKVDKNGQFFEDNFLEAVHKELRSSDVLTPLLIAGGLGELHFVEDFKPTLRIHGLLTQVKQRSPLFGNLEMTSLVFSEKMYRFISWLDYDGKFGSDPLYELVEYCPKSD